MQGRFDSDGPAATERLGAELAAGLAPGDVVLIEGELGAGKTTFVRGAARALGVRGPVTSPTFTIGQRYPAGERTVAHLDLYRLGTLDDEDPGLLDEYLSTETIAFVEWPHALGTSLVGLERAPVRVTLAHAGDDRREVRVR